jgi:hypothetical protein
MARNSDASNIGYCLGCGRRLTLCGRPFTAVVDCRHCGASNVYRDSQQPVALRYGTAGHYGSDNDLTPIPVNQETPRCRVE